ncbi:MAG: T9SS type A sorting domain-containing protein [Bacteroidota bacterium]
MIQSRPCSAPRGCFPAFVLSALLVMATSSGFGWGATAHRFINKNAVLHLPPVMAQLAAQQTFLMDHASDADSRKSSDTAEGPKHYLDLESYPDFAHLPADLSALIGQYGWTAVADNGILPWAIVWAEDSLTEQFRRGDWGKAYQTAADIGHYVGDAHQPLHCTVNYDGKLTGNSGIHSRYETGMINAFQSSLTVQQDSARFIPDVYAHALEDILQSYEFVDSILQADTYAKNVSGWSGSGQVPSSYYTALWERTGSMTERLIQRGTVSVASLWYTAWVNAGRTATSVAATASFVPSAPLLEQNYPNPFNPNTVIRGEWTGDSKVRLVVFDLLGREVAVLADGRYPAGRYSFTFDGSAVASGVYFYRLETGSFVQTKRMLLLK